MIKRFVLFLLMINGVCFGQKTQLSLDSCIQMAKRNYPLIKQNHLIEESRKNAVQEDNKNWLPKFSLSSQATYQSEVISFPPSLLSMLGFGDKPFPHDQYLTALGLQQTIFDAGQIKQQKLYDKLSSENDLLKNEVELYKLITQVSQLYSTVLLMRENMNILNTSLDDINNKKVNLAESLKSGLVLQSDLDELEAAGLKIEQSIIESKNNINATYETLKMYINQTVDDNTEFSSKPLVNTAPGDEINRPELKLYEAQKEMFDARYRLVNRNAMPKLSVSGQGDYGRPGPNFLNQNLRFFGVGGIGLNWNIASLYTLSNEKQNATINKQMIDVQKEVFDFNIKTALASQAAQINSLKEIITKDRVIVQKRHNIRVTASSQLENGTITSVDYLTQLNAEMQAILNQKVNEVRLMNAITNYNTTKGITNY